MTITNDMVNHPKHYNSHPSGVECIEVVEHMGFNLGNAFKYVYRAPSKGKRIEDYNKSIFYLERELHNPTEKSVPVFNIMLLKKEIRKPRIEADSKVALIEESEPRAVLGWFYHCAWEASRHYDCGMREWYISQALGAIKSILQKVNHATIS